MAFRGFFALDGIEIANSSRVVANIGSDVPTSDVGLLVDSSGAPLVEDPPGSGLYIPGPPVTGPDVDGLYNPESLEGSGGLYPLTGDCALTQVLPGLMEIPSTSAPIGNFYTPPDGSRRYDKGLIQVGDTCWGPPMTCGNCRRYVEYDDTWPGLREFLGDAPYRTELAPWYTTRLPESGEFGGVWVLDVKGLGATPVERPVSEMVGSGGVAGPYRDASRTLLFDALLLACTNAGLEYGLEWLTCRLRETNTRVDSVLRFLNAHPSYSAADPDTLVREAHGLVLTKSPEVRESIGTGGKQHQQATMYRIEWEMAVTSPYVYLPPIDLDVAWDSITPEPIEWAHAADCTTPASCEQMPVLFSTECEPELIEVVNRPPPVCGGCMPVCGVDTYVYTVPTFDYVVRCRATAVNLTIRNTGVRPLTLQAYWRVCNSNTACDDQLHPLQVSGLPQTATLTVDSVQGRYWAELDDRLRRPRGIVGTPAGAPWRPTIIDRSLCWEFVVVAPGDVDFEVSMSLIDREP